LHHLYLYLPLPSRPSSSRAEAHGSTLPLTSSPPLTFSFPPLLPRLP
jgi:hypothetical protein